MISHLDVRVPWHDNQWDGTVCCSPSANSFCVDLDRIREERDDAAEDEVAGRHFADLDIADLPACRAESGAFMSDRDWWQLRSHPYATIKAAQTTHGNLLPTRVRVPAHGTLAIPFWWMLRQNQERVDEVAGEVLPPDEESPFPSAWVFGRARQEAISELFFGRLKSSVSLVAFYTKSGHPLGDSLNRLIVGIGELEDIGPILHYDVTSAASYPMWDRVVRHSIRADGSRGFLAPYHQYLATTGDPDEDSRREALAAEIALVPEPAHTAAYSYAGELATPDVMLSTLVRALDVVRRVREHGIASGPWSEREEWLNLQLATVWADRGAFPGIGGALEALGLRLGTAMVFDLYATGRITSNDDPWPLLDAIFRGNEPAPSAAYEDDVRAVSRTWTNLAPERRELLVLLSRFALSPAQAKRWFEPSIRAKALRGSVTDADVIANPYRIAELDLGDATEYPVGIGVLDRGLLPEDTVAVRHPVPDPSAVGAALDPRRVRAALVTTLRDAASNGDALLSRDELLEKVGQLDLARPCAVPTDWPAAHADWLDGEVTLLDVPVDPATERIVPSLQLTELADRESRLRKILTARAGKEVPSLSEDWAALVRAAVTAGGAEPDEADPRHRIALAEQAEALERITTRRLSVLVGRAGTGKTTVLGALMQSEQLERDGVLFLAPTGKASVRITMKTSASAMTVAQFLYRLKRYDGIRQRPLYDGESQYAQERTVVIDESSMLTLDDLVAVFNALDMAHVRRIILVGDPNQLPPIGVGRPFADLVAMLDDAANQGSKVGAALARLTTELRSTQGAPSDALRLASWYTREPQPVDADSVLSDLELGGTFNDLEIRTWSTPDELRAQLDELLVQELGLADPGDVEGFNLALGLTKEGWVPFDDHDGAERFQLLSPVRQHPYGVHDLNRWMQLRYRSAQLRKASGRGGTALGDDNIVWGDKVILVRNGQRDGYRFAAREKVREYLANGEVGFVAPPPKGQKGYLNLALAHRAGTRYAMRPGQFGGSGGPLELAYALTVHKSQGSEFDRVFVVLPQSSRLMTRELLYTAITRSREKLVLLVEGNDPTFLYSLTRPERSETARRNTNLFVGAIREASDSSPFAEHLVHRTLRGELVRSKSEVVIANQLHALGLDYAYEKPLDGETTGGRRWPDFSFVDPSGDVIVWEHLGMLDRPDYQASWNAKAAWYEANGYTPGTNLFTTDEAGGRLDSTRIAEVAARVAELIA